MNTPSSKDALREFLASKVAETVEQNPEAVVLYAAERAPDSKAYVKRPTVREVAFERELNKMRDDLALKSDPEPTPPDNSANGSKNLSLDDFPGLLRPVSKHKF